MFTKYYATHKQCQYAKAAMKKLGKETHNKAFKYVPPASWLHRTPNGAA